jgi:hypothetical protein
MKYQFEESVNDVIDQRIRQFNRQIKEEYKLADGKKEYCPSYWNKLLFIKTVNLNINDWNIIRSGDYWDIRDSLHGIDQTKFILKRVKNYLGN